jgi:hypothetical protein
MQQNEVVAGDSLNFTVAGGAYPASAGWVLTYRLVPRAVGAEINFNATASGDDFVVALDAAATENWAAGAYTWWQRVEKAGEKYTLGQGQLTVRPNPATLTGGFDGRSEAVKALEEAKAARASWITSGGRIASYQIAGRTMTYKSAIEIDREIRFWEGEVARHQQAERIAAGLPTGGRFYVRAVR